jgi:hypothetical protein
VQIKEFETPSLLPTLSALDAEFECENEQWPAERTRQEGVPMHSTFRATQSEFPRHAVSSPVEAMKRSPADAATMRPSLARRALLGLARLVIIFFVGVGTTLAWQSYGDAARAMIAKSSPQLGWLAPHTAPVSPSASEVVAPASAASSDVQQLTFGLAAVRQSVDLLVAQLAAAQQQMGSDIAKLQVDEQAILHKLSATPPRPAAAPAPKPALMTPSTPAPTQAR